jgi:hypothetical protein
MGAAMDWRFWRWSEQRREAEWDREMAAHLAWESGMIARGWHHWLSLRPKAAVVEVSRREWPTIAVWTVAEVSPWTNIVGLWWRESRGAALDGGAIIELEAVEIAGRLQHQCAPNR